jgi:chromosome segregation ATPase
VLDGESDAQLRGTLSNFETVMINRTNELREMQRSIDTLHGQISQLRSKNDTVNIQMGKAQSLQEQCRAIREQLSEVCTQTGRKYNISGNDAQHFLVQINKEVSFLFLTSLSFQLILADFYTPLTGTIIAF